MLLTYIRTHLFHLLRVYFIGFGMGVADLIPGVSGGTIAFIFGIYDELLLTIRLVTGHALKTFSQGKVREAVEMVPWGFALPLGAGLASAILVLSKIIKYLFEHQPQYLKAFFFGLVISSTIIVLKRIKQWSAPYVAAFAASTVATYFLMGLRPAETPEHPAMYFLSGFIAISAMILPGISGSFMLLIMGKYHKVLGHVTAIVDALKDTVTGNPGALVSGETLGHIGTLSIFMLGIVLGIAVFARILTVMLKRYHDPMVAVLAGFMLGSLRVIWPWFEKKLLFEKSVYGKEVYELTNHLPTLSVQSGIMVLLMVGAIGLMFFFERFDATEEHHDDVEDFQRLEKVAGDD